MAGAPGTVQRILLCRPLYSGLWRATLGHGSVGPALNQWRIQGVEGGWVWIQEFFKWGLGRSGSSKRQVRKNFQTEKQKKKNSGGGGGGGVDTLTT